MRWMLRIVSWAVGASGQLEGNRMVGRAASFELEVEKKSGRAGQAERSIDAAAGGRGHAKQPEQVRAVDAARRRRPDASVRADSAEGIGEAGTLLENGAVAAVAARTERVEGFAIGVDVAGEQAAAVAPRESVTEGIELAGLAGSPFRRG